jgi:uncharacterized membrane protein YbhN (UPF0104 family)
MTTGLAPRPPREMSAIPVMIDPPESPRGPRRRDSWGWRIGAVLTALLLVSAAIVSVADVDGDTGGDLLGLLRLIGRDLLHLRWPFAALVLLLGSLHYLAAAIAARAACGIRLPLGETMLAQLAASTADRLTPGGVGAAAVNGRYFHRRGLTLPAALGAVASLHFLGPVTDIGVLAFLVFAGSWFGLNGGAHEVGALTAKLTHSVSTFTSPWVLATIGVVLALLVAFRHWHKPKGKGRDWAMFWVPIRQLLAHPSRLLTLAAASGATTLILAFAFAASVAMVPGPRPVAGLGALMIAFLLGTAAGNALPIPGGLGTTEAALISVLVGLHVPVAAAVQQVLIFRIITFWLPALFGILAARKLRRCSAL